MRLRLLLGSALLAVTLTACGDDESSPRAEDTSSASPSAADDAGQASFDECMAEAEAERDDMRGEDAATDDLLDSLEEIDRMVCEDKSDPDSLPTEWVPELVEITGDPDAPEEFRDIADAVESGDLTWEEWYDDPGALEGGIDLLNALNGELGFDIEVPDLTP